MSRNTRRGFFEDVGSGMLIAGLGASLASDFGISSAFADDGSDTLDFGKLHPLVGLLQETPVDKLQPVLVKRLKEGSTDLRQLISAAALANAETFGGVDYVGFHTEMALLPAYQMARELPQERRPLPVLKVLYRNTHRIQESGLAKKKMLRPISQGDLPDGAQDGKLLLEATRSSNTHTHCCDSAYVFASVWSSLINSGIFPCHQPAGWFRSCLINIDC